MSECGREEGREVHRQVGGGTETERHRQRDSRDNPFSCRPFILFIALAHATHTSTAETMPGFPPFTVKPTPAGPRTMKKSIIDPSVYGRDTVMPTP